MSSSQPGWHPDPVAPAPGQPPQLRYWDGTAWTEHTAPARAAYARGTHPPTTPDGVPLAGWWSRAGAVILDAMLVGILGALVALPWLREVLDVYQQAIDDLLADATTGAGRQLDTQQMQRDLARPLAIIGAINLAIGFLYNVGFLMWRQATPGKLLLGLRVRLRGAPGPMPIGTVLLRWVGQFGVGVLGLIPFVGSVSGLYSLLDYLWPLWDDQKQAIHDKIAKTNVVRMR